MKNDGIYVHPHRSVNDWYNLQKRIWNFEEINPDKEIIEKISDENWKVDLSLAHKNLKTKLAEYDNKNDPPDFFIMTDIEISKFPIETFFKIVEKKFRQSRYGGYIALLSYYINSKKTYNNLGPSYKENIDKVIRDYLKFANMIENKSAVYDYPIEILDSNGQLLEGSNFIFVHPNIRYWVWK